MKGKKEGKEEGKGEEGREENTRTGAKVKEVWRKGE